MSAGNTLRSTPTGGPCRCDSVTPWCQGPGFPGVGRCKNLPSVRTPWGSQRVRSWNSDVLLGSRVSPGLVRFRPVPCPLIPRRAPVDSLKVPGRSSSTDHPMHGSETSRSPTSRAPEAGGQEWGPGPVSYVTQSPRASVTDRGVEGPAGGGTRGWTTGSGYSSTGVRGGRVTDTCRGTVCTTEVSTGTRDPRSTSSTPVPSARPPETPCVASDKFTRQPLPNFKCVPVTPTLLILVSKNRGVTVGKQ